MSATIDRGVAAPGADAKRDWVLRVLGVDLAPGQPIARSPAPSPAPSPAQSPVQPSASAARAADAAREIEGGLGPLSMAFRKARLDWGAARTQARAALAALQTKLRELLAGEPDFPALAAEIDKFGGALAGLDDRLDTTLDQAMNATDPAQQATLKAEAVAIIGEYTGFIEGHPFLGKIDHNEVLPVAVFSVLSNQLQRMARQLA